MSPSWSLSPKHCSFFRQVHHIRHRATQSTEEEYIECIPLLRVTQYEQGGSGNYLPDSEWNCQLLQSTPAAIGMSGRIVKLEDIYNLPKGTVHQFQSGITVLKISAAHITGEESIKIPQGSAATIEANEADANDDVAIEPANVEKKVLVVRVKTEVSSTTSSSQRLSE